jgi:hypothetical protein
LELKNQRDFTSGFCIHDGTSALLEIELRLCS